MTQMTAMVKSELYRVDLALVNGPSMTDAFGRETEITGVVMTFSNGKPTAIRFESGSADVFVDPMDLERHESWPAWLRDLLDQHRPRSLTNDLAEQEAINAQNEVARRHG